MTSEVKFVLKKKGGGTQTRSKNETEESVALDVMGKTEKPGSYLIHEKKRRRGPITLQRKEM